MKTFILLAIFSLPVFAEHFQISGELQEFKSHDGLLLRGCESKNCLALKAVKKHSKINLQKIRKGQQYQGSIGSDVCRLVYKGRSILGVNKDKDQRAFCVFKDNSLIETNSLGRYLTDKNIVKE